MAVLGDETGRVLGTGRGGPCNHVGAAEGRAKFRNAIGGCVQEACAAAGIDVPQFEVVVAGFSGGAEDKDAYLRELVQAREYIVTTDAVIALAGATAGAPGIITIAGTGSISYGRNARKQFARVGGWGYIFGDEGGGFDITRQALRSALRYEEGWGPATSLRDALLSATGAANVNQLMHNFYTSEFPRPKIASMSKLVDDAAVAGDSAARDILLNAAQQLASFTGAVRAQLFTRGEQVRVAHIGGVYKSKLLLERFRALVELEDGAEVIRPHYGPATGALIEAYATLGVAVQNAPEEKA
jgi:N-acetylglucosamine kinase-like BadF-type ATPase